VTATDIVSLPAEAAGDLLGKRRLSLLSIRLLRIVTGPLAGRVIGGGKGSSA
jgi:hypothetical protein